jgi:TolB-like protein
VSILSELKRRNVFRVAIAYVVASWVLLQVADLFMGYVEAPHWVMHVLMFFTALGFVVAMIVAWVYELTPEGIKREKDIRRGESVTVQTGRKLDRVIIAFLAVAVVVLLYRQSAPELGNEPELAAPTPPHESQQATKLEPVEKSIAVLPFVNMSDDPGNEYFSDGISEELLSLLAKIPELRVISRSSAFAFKGEKIKAPEVAQKLNVDHVLEGSVRKAGSRVRITAQLIEAHTDTHLWSETYDRTLDDIFAIQDEIAVAVVDALKVTLLGEAPKTREVDPEAYTLYLQAKHLYSQGTDDNLMQSTAMLQKVLALAPDYAPAWCALGRNHMERVRTLLISRDEGLALVREALNQALRIDPNYAEAHANLGNWAIHYESDLETAAHHLQKALSLEPANDEVLRRAASLAWALGRFDQGHVIDKYLVANDPLNSMHLNNLAFGHLYLGQPEETIAAAKTALILSPEREFGHLLLTRALLLQGNYQAALEAIQKEPKEYYRLFGLVLVYHAQGLKAESDSALAEYIEKYGQVRPIHLAGSIAYRGEADRAFEWLERAAAMDISEATYNLHDPMFANLHDDPRWLPFLEDVGMAPSQLAAIEFNVTLPE